MSGQFSSGLAVRAGQMFARKTWCRAGNAVFLTWWSALPALLILCSGYKIFKHPSSARELEVCSSCLPPQVGAFFLAQWLAPAAQATAIKKNAPHLIKSVCACVDCGCTHTQGGRLG